MPEWKKTTLDQVISLKRGFDLPEPTRNPGPYPVLGSSGISGWHDEGPVTGPGVTIGRSGTSIGVATYSDGSYWPLNTTLFVEDFKRNNPKFIFHLLDNINFKGFNSGSAQPSLNRNYIAQIAIIIPPPSEQEVIAAVLGTLDDKIAVNDRIEANYEELLRARFEELAIDIDPDPANLIRTAEIVEFNPALPVSRSQDSIYLDMASISINAARVRAWSRRAPKSGTRFSNGDTVMARITPCLENGKTAFIDFMKPGEVGIGSTEFIVLRAKGTIPVHLPYFLARSPRFRANAIRNMVGSSGRQRVSAAQLAGFPLAQPDHNQLAAFGDVACIVFDHIKSIGSESRTLARLRDTLLPRLISGEIRVRDAEQVAEEVT